jgi:hypothetical protein
MTRPAPLPQDHVIDALRNGDTAHDVAARLHEQPGQTGRVSCARVVPVLNRLRSEGIVVRRIKAKDDDSSPLARWSFA